MLDADEPIDDVRSSVRPDPTRAAVRGDRGGPPEVSRPTPPLQPAERLRAWLDWYGPARLAVTVCCVVLVAAGGFWLVRAPAPSAEATLPHASAPPGSVVGPAVTLPVASGPPGSSDTPPPELSTPPTSVASGPVFVHVAGEVRDPGVYELVAGARADDAVRRAGGPTEDADLDAVNLAEFLADGQRLFVPAIGVVDHSATPVLTPPSPPTASLSGSVGPSGDSSGPVGPIDLNRAPIDELERLPGVGPATARAIVDDRESNGPFVSVDDLERVAGVGPAKLAALRDLVTV